MKKKNTFTISKVSLLIIILSFPVSFMYFAALRLILSEKFFLDTGTIRAAMKPEAVRNDYSSTGDFYRRLGFHWDTPVIYELLFAASIFLLFTIAIVIIFRLDFLDFKTLMWYILVLIFFGPYFSMISKDLIVFIYILFSSIFINSKKYIPIFILISSIYALNYRKYWLITIVLAVVIWLICKKMKKNKILTIMIISTVYLVSISVIYHFHSGSYLSVSRSSVNLFRTNDVYSRTMTRTVLPPNSIINDLVNTIYNGINLVIPIDGFGSANELVYYIWLYSILFMIWRTYKACNGINGNVLFYLIFFFSFIFTQSIFEPDMGSAFRHQLTVSSFIPFMLLYYRRNKMSIGG